MLLAQSVVFDSVLLGTCARPLGGHVASHRIASPCISHMESSDYDYVHEYVTCYIRPFAQLRSQPRSLVAHIQTQIRKAATPTLTHRIASPNRCSPTSLDGSSSDREGTAQPRTSDAISPPPRALVEQSAWYRSTDSLHEVIWSDEAILRISRNANDSMRSAIGNFCCRRQQMHCTAYIFSLRL